MGHMIKALWCSVNKTLTDDLREAETEVWDLENDTMEMITPELKNYEYGIALYVVDSDFCKK